MSSSPRHKKSFLSKLDVSMLAGATLTVAYYMVMSLPGFKDSTLAHYTTEHAVEYVIVALFLWGLCDIALRLCGFPIEFMALRRPWLPPKQGREPVTQAKVLLDELHQRPQWQLASRAGQRLTSGLQFVIDEGTARDFRDHLQFLAEADDDRTHANYTLTRFIAGVTPILGFLGTVVHFGSALSGISFDQMSARLPIIVAEMGTAFNTTTVALAASMSMMFAVFICERIEKGLIHSIDHLANRDLLNRFEDHDAEIIPFVGALQSASQQALRTIEVTLQQQIVQWSEALEKLFAKFEERQALETRGWESALLSLQQRQEANEAAHDERILKMLEAVESAQKQHVDRLQSTLDRVARIGQEVGSLTETLQAVARGEGQLSELQGTLANNLRLIRETQQLDEAMHGLTAAIHLLTARHGKLGTPPDSAAA
mgnify:CR=1 FL=1